VPSSPPPEPEIPTPLPRPIARGAGHPYPGPGGSGRAGGPGRYAAFGEKRTLAKTGDPRPAEEVRVPRVGEMDGFAETGSSYTGRVG